MLLRRESDELIKDVLYQEIKPLEPKYVVGGGSDDRLIVVAASGGGIQAAAWTAQVLSGLDTENDGNFGPKVRLISAVSGGSVGAMYFVDAYRERTRGRIIPNKGAVLTIEHTPAPAFVIRPRTNNRRPGKSQTTQITGRRPGNDL